MQFLLTLFQLRLQARHFLLQLLATPGEQRQFAAAEHRHGLLQLGGKGRLAPRHFRLQPFDAQQQGLPIRLAFPHAGGKARVVQPHQRRTGFHQLAFAHEQLGDDAALQVLDLLQARRGNRLAIGAGHLVHHGEVRPESGKHEEAQQRPERQPRHAGNILVARPPHVGQHISRHTDAPRAARRAPPRAAHRPAGGRAPAPAPGPPGSAARCGG